MQIGLGILVSTALLLISCGGESSADADSNTSISSESTDSSAATEAVSPQPTEPSDTTQAGADADIIPGIGPACEMAEVAMVEDAFHEFGASVERGVEGYAQNCTYWLGSGSVLKADIFYLGTADQWDEIRSQWEETRNGTIEVDGIGGEAFRPADHGPRELVFVAGDHIFWINVWGGPTLDEVFAKLDLATRALAKAMVALHS